MDLATVWRLTLREFRGGTSGFRIFLLCLILGVAAIAAVGSAAQALDAGLQSDARRLLGGDVEVSQMYRPLDSQSLQLIENEALAVTTTVEMRGMAGARGQRTLVEVKAVDASYPLVGELDSTGEGALNELLGSRGGTFGTLVDSQVLMRLGADLGDTLRVGELGLEIRGRIEKEPDRGIDGVEFGPRVLISRDALAVSGLIAPGSMVRYFTKALLREPLAVSALIESIEEAQPKAGFRIRTLKNVSSGVQRFIDRMSQFLTLVGLTALLVGGVGVSNAVRGYLDTKVQTVATLKCLGASAAGVFAVYLTQIGLLACFGIVLGLGLGTTVPFLVELVAESALPVRMVPAVYPEALLSAAVFGALVALVFSLWPLARVNAVKPSRLFRARAAPPNSKASLPLVVVMVLGVGALIALAIFTASERELAVGFVLMIAATFATLFLAAVMIRWLASRVRAVRNPGLRLALGNLHRPGSITTSVVLSIGLGLTVLSTIAMIERNLTYQIEQQLPEQAPAFFFVDIQNDQVKSFVNTLTEVSGVDRVDRVPMLRGRITELNGVGVDHVEVDSEMRWLIETERGLTYHAEAPPNTEIVDGEWWSEDYQGETLVSFGEEQARGLGLEIGDRVTVSVLGRNITGRIHNLRRIDWRSLGINFVMVFSPGAFDATPYTYLATAYMSSSVEDATFKAVSEAFPNVTIVRVKDAIEAASRLVGSIAGGIRIAALFTLVVGVLVLAGSMVASHRRRVYDAVVLKVLGAKRSRVVGAFAMEYGLLALTTALVASVVGSITSFAVVDGFMEARWEFQPAAFVTVVAVCTLVVLGVGLAGTWRILGHKAAPLLRND